MSTSNAQAKLDYIAGTKTAIKDAIEAKGVVVGSETFRNYATKIGEIETGGGTGDYLVRFIDYDGTVLKEQYVNSGEAATAPTTPTHSLLTFNSWNRAFTIVTSNMDIGAVYDTTDGKSHLFITLTVVTGFAPTLYLQKSTADEMTINWGDGSSETDSAIGNLLKMHTYAAAGDYVITIECAGDYTFGHGNWSESIFNGYEAILTKILVGSTGSFFEKSSFYHCNSLRNISFPYGVSLSYSVFNACSSLQAVVIPIGVSDVKNSLFQDCHSLQKVIIPDGVTSIGIQAFYNCYSLQNLTIPDSVTTISDYTFYRCYSLKSVVLPASLTNISANLFYDCYSLWNITIPDSVETIESNAFNDCSSLKNITIPDGVTSIGGNAFYQCSSLESLIIPDSVTSIGYALFYRCYSLTNVTLPSGAPEIGADFFEECSSLVTFTIPEGQISIGNDFAYQCYSLKSAYLPSTITEIADDAFSYCEQLNTLEILATTPPTLNAGAIDIYSDILKIYVPAASVDAYKTATNWITLADYIYPIT